MYGRKRINLSCTIEQSNLFDEVSKKCGFEGSCQMTITLLEQYALFKSLGREKFLLHPGTSMDLADLMEWLEERMSEDMKKRKEKREGSLSKSPGGRPKKVRD